MTAGPAISKALLIDAIKGRGFKSTQEAVHYEKVGLARSSGNQWNEAWSWIPERLELLDERILLQIYESKTK